MEVDRQHPRRAFSVCPSHRGFGFAVFDPKMGLIDWGVARLYSNNDEEFLLRLEALVQRDAATLLVLEDVSDTRQRARARRRIDKAMVFARLRRLRVVRVSRGAACVALDLSERATNHEMATAVAKVFPELIQHLPPRRKLGNSEDERMKLFRAVMLLLFAGRDI
jgi:hypothetical protein